MDDPIGHLRDLMPLLQFCWADPPSAQRTVKLAAVASRLKQIHRMVQDEIERCLPKSKPF